MISQNDLLFALNIQLFQECFISREKGNVFLENIINVVKDTSAPNINKSKLIIFIIDMCNNCMRNEKCKMMEIECHIIQNRLWNKKWDFLRVNKNMQ